MSAAEGVTVAPPELAAGQIRLPIELPAELAGRRRLRLAYQVNDAGSAAPQWRDVVLALGEVVLAPGRTAARPRRAGPRDDGLRRSAACATSRRSARPGARGARADRSLTPPDGGPRLEAWTSRPSPSSCPRSRWPSPSRPRPGCGPGCRCFLASGAGAARGPRPRAVLPVPRLEQGPRAVRRGHRHRARRRQDPRGRPRARRDRHAAAPRGGGPARRLRPRHGDRPAHLGRARHRGRRALGPRAARRQVGAARGLDRGRPGASPTRC